MAELLKPFLIQRVEGDLRLLITHFKNVYEGKITPSSETRYSFHAKDDKFSAKVRFGLSEDSYVQIVRVGDRQSRPVQTS